MPTDDDDDDRPRRRPRRDDDDDERPARRPRNSRDYEDDDRPARRTSAAMPGGAKVAGIIWIAYGAIGILSNIVSFVLVAGQGGGQQVGSGICGILIAVAFLIVGIQTVKGAAPSLMGNGIGSLIFGALNLICGVVLLAGGGMLAAAGNAGGGGAPAGAGVAGGTIMILAAIPIIMGLALLVAGVLALMNKSAYDDWRVAQGLGKKKRRTMEERDYDDRPRRRVRDEDDEDDRPRRRPRRDDDE